MSFASAADLYFIAKGKAELAQRLPTQHDGVARQLRPSLAWL